MLCRQVAQVSILNPPERHSPCLAGYCISGLEMGCQGAGEGGFGATLVIRAVSGSGWGWGVCEYSEVVCKVSQGPMGRSCNKGSAFLGPPRKTFPERSHSSSRRTDSTPGDLSAPAPSFALGLASHPAALSPHLQSHVTTGGTSALFKRLLRTCSNWKSSFLSPGNKTHSFPSSLPALPQVKPFLFYQDGEWRESGR